MAGQLRSVVTVRDADGVAHQFRPGAEVPGWAAKQITNPKAWAEAPTAGSDDADGPPPKGGPGSGVDKWVAYAESNGVDLTDDQKKSRDDVIAALEAADVPTE